MPEALQETDLIEALRFPFRASMDYTEYAQTAAGIAGAHVGEFHDLVRWHKYTGGSAQYRQGLELLGTHAFVVVNEFAELGYSSRPLAEATLVEEEIEHMFRLLNVSPRPAVDEAAAADPEWPAHLETVDDLVGQKLHAIAHRAFLWGRTGDPDSESDKAPSQATPQRIFVEKDVLALGPAVGEITGDVTTAMIRANCGIFGRLTLRRMPDLDHEIERFVTEELRAAVKSES